MPRKSWPRLRKVTIKGKEFHQVSVPQLEEVDGSGPLRTGIKPKRFYSAVEDEISRLALYTLEEEYGAMRMLPGWRTTRFEGVRCFDTEASRLGVFTDLPKVL